MANRKIPISPAEVVKRTANMQEILESLRSQQLIVKGPHFFGTHSFYVDNDLKHAVLLPKADLTTHVFIGDPIHAEEWRTYDENGNMVRQQGCEPEDLEWKVYTDVVLYKGKALPSKAAPEPYWGEVVEIKSSMTI